MMRFDLDVREIAGEVSVAEGPRQLSHDGLGLRLIRSVSDPLGPRQLKSEFLVLLTCRVRTDSYFVFA